MGKSSIGVSRSKIPDTPQTEGVRILGSTIGLALTGLHPSSTTVIKTRLKSSPTEIYNRRVSWGNLRRTRLELPRRLVERYQIR